jgi:hypothetical protein
VNFALLIQQVISARGIQYHIQSQNQGILDSDVILIVETWLESVRDRYKERFRDGLRFQP